MFCFDIQKKPEIIIDENNDFLDIECEVKIPTEFNREYYNNSTKMFEIEGSPKYSDVYAAFETEINRMSAYLTMKSI